MKPQAGALLAAALACLWLSGPAGAAPPRRFDCGGKVERQAWLEWDGGARGFVRQSLLRERLQGRGDVYALYDAQTYVHNLASMARRCKRTGRLREIAGVIRIAYDALEPGPASSPGRRWRCRGGICNRANRLLDQEVMLSSAQFLGLASALANALASATADAGEREAREFVNDTTRILAEHLERWAAGGAVERLRGLAAARPADIRNGSSALFFTDIDLWLIAGHAELAGLLAAGGREPAPRLREHLAALLAAFQARLSVREICSSEGTREEADLDRGYWRLYHENRYAGDESASKPVVCSRRDSGMRAARPPAPRDDTGWDISHARRLVHALDALERNRAALRAVYGLRDAQLPAAGIEAAFANTLAARVWNGDSAQPLFANYWSGANGWYRASYDERDGACAEGIPPHGLSDAFATGGYIAWAARQPVIGALGRRLYHMVEQGAAAEAAFIARHYPKLGKAADARDRSLARLMFFASLVGHERRPA
jgi:hypothetical protein